MTVTNQINTQPLTPADVALAPGLYAIRHINNWDGEGDICTALARLDAAGIWTFDENGRRVLEYNGDKVLSAWPLAEKTAQVPYESLTTVERIAVLEQEEREMPLKAWRVRHAEVVAARSARQAVEVMIAHIGEWMRETYHYTAADAVEMADFQMESGPDVEMGLTFQYLLENAKAPAFLGTLNS
jgi:hypothetical protein